MAYCGKCGKPIEEDANFCTNCGAPVEAQQKEQNPEQAAQQEQPENKNEDDNQQTDYAAKIAALNDTADTTAEFDKNDIRQNTAMAVLAYISWLVLIPILAAPKSKFARFHANQGLILLIAEVIWFAAQKVLGFVFKTLMIPFISSILGITNILFVVLMIIGIVNAANGMAKELPVIGQFRLLK